jgi:hypothetical protein
MRFEWEDVLIKLEHYNNPKILNGAPILLEYVAFHACIMQVCNYITILKVLAIKGFTA